MLLVCDFSLCINILRFTVSYLYWHLFVMCTTFVFLKMLCKDLEHILAACNNPSGLSSKSVSLCANIQWHTHTHRQESFYHDPRCRPVAACLKPNLYRAREIAPGLHCRQGWAHLSLSQTALVSLMGATQIRRVKGDTDLRCCRGEHPTGRSGP